MVIIKGETTAYAFSLEGNLHLLSIPLIKVFDPVVITASLCRFATEPWINTCRFVANASGSSPYFLLSLIVMFLATYSKEKSPYNRETTLVKALR